LKNIIINFHVFIDASQCENLFVIVASDECIGHCYYNRNQFFLL